MTIPASVSHADKIFKVGDHAANDKSRGRKFQSGFD